MKQSTLFYEGYRLILADPPWSYGNGGNGAARNHYPTMTPAQIAALPIAQLAAPDCILIMWATWPQLYPVAGDVIKAWGFTYVTGFPWIKLLDPAVVDVDGNLLARPAYGTGVWARGCSEPVLIAKRGKAMPEERGWLGLLSERLEHSRKPEDIYQYAESIAPLDLPPARSSHLELFARRRRPHWDAFGHIEDSISLEQFTVGAAKP